MSTVAVCPNFSSNEALFNLQKYWNISGKMRPLDSYLDQNFLVTNDLGEKFVLKIANVETPSNWIDLQNQVLVHLASDGIPSIVSASTGETMLFIQDHWWRVLVFLEGSMLSREVYRSPKLLSNIGFFAGTISKKLANFSHEAAEREMQWDLQQAPSLIKKWKGFVKDIALSNKIEQVIQLWDANETVIQQLPKSVIHADLTRFNLLIDAKGENVKGLIDFGDVCYSWTVGELAVLVLESVMTGSRYPFNEAALVIGAYHSVFPLQEIEIKSLYSLILLRSALIVCASARQLSIEPDNEYVLKQATEDQKMFLTIAIEKENFATALFLNACGYKVDTSFSQIHNTQVASLFKECTDIKAIEIQPSASIYNDGAWLDNNIVHNNILAALDKGFGYAPFKSTIISPLSIERVETETVALGLFVFAPEKTKVIAPVDLTFVGDQKGKSVFSSQVGKICIYGLNHPNAVGETIEKGCILGYVEEHKILSFLPNGLFIQIDDSLSAPIFCKPSELKGWSLLVQDPSFLIGVHSNNHSDVTSTLADRRASKIQQSQEYYYQNPMSLVRGWKQYLIDDMGQVYLDAINNVSHIGHAHPKVTQAATTQLQKLNTNARFLYEDNVAYAEQLLSFFPGELQVVFFTCTGSEANDLALRLARAYTNQQDVIVIDGEYHGNTTAVDEISTCLMDNPTASKSVRTYTHPLIQPNTFRGKYNQDSANVAKEYAKDVYAKIEYIQSQGRGVAAFISESLLGSGGGVEMPKGYLAEVYQAIHNAGGVCIADEVQIGFGRMGSHFWGFEKEGVRPDIVTLGKPMGNGYPISAVITTKAIAEAYQKKYTYFNTYAGSPVACQVASAVLDTIITENLQENAAIVGGFLKQELQQLVAEFECVGAIYGHAMYLGVDLVFDKHSRQPDAIKAMKVCEVMKQRGVIIYPTGDYYNILKIKPPMCFTKENASTLVEQLRQVLSDIENE